MIDNPEILCYFLGPECRRICLGPSSYTVADGSFNSSQAWIFMSFSGLDEVQILNFVVVDRMILCELNTIPNCSFTCYLHAIFVLLATHWTFNIA